VQLRAGAEFKGSAGGALVFVQRDAKGRVFSVHLSCNRHPVQQDKPEHLTKGEQTLHYFEHLLKLPAASSLHQALIKT
jgi:hypothetical protein